MFQFFNLVAPQKIEENGDVNKRLVGGFKYVLCSPGNLGKEDKPILTLICFKGAEPSTTN